MSDESFAEVADAQGAQEAPAAQLEAVLIAEDAPTQAPKKQQPIKVPVRRVKKARAPPWRSGHSSDFIQLNITTLQALSANKDYNTGRLLPQKPLKRVNLSELTQRFRAYQELYSDKLRELRLKHAEEATEGCTFKPTVNQETAPESVRSAQKYYKDMLKHQHRTQDKVNSMREVKQEAARMEGSCSFKPTLCGKSERMLVGKAYAEEPCHLRLYQMHKLRSKDPVTSTCYSDGLSRDTETPLSRAFCPKVNRYSHEMVRSKQVDRLLYEDAQRRMNMQPPPVQEALTRPSKTSLSILSKRFLAEFQKHGTFYDPDNTGAVNYTQYRSIFKAIGFLSKVSNEEIVSLLSLWRTLGGEQGKVKVSDLQVAMMGIMGYYQPWMNDPTSQDFTLSARDVPSHHTKYKALFMNRGMAEPEDPLPAKSLGSTECAEESLAPEKPTRKPKQTFMLAEELLTTIEPLPLNLRRRDKKHTVAATNTFDSLFSFGSSKRPKNDPTAFRRSASRTFTSKVVEKMPVSEQHSLESDHSVNEILEKVEFVESITEKEISDLNSKSELSLTEEKSAEEPFLFIVNIEQEHAEQLRVAHTQDACAAVKAFAALHKLSDSEASKLLDHVTSIIQENL